MTSVVDVRAYRLPQVRSRVDRVKVTADPDALPCSDAMHEVVELLCSVPDLLKDVEVAQATGWLFWLRFATRGVEEANADLLVALGLLVPLRRLGLTVPSPIGRLFERSPATGPDGGAVLAVLGRAQLSAALANADEDALSRSVVLLQRPVAATGPNHGDYADCLNCLGGALMTRFDRTHLLTDLQEAIAFSQRAVAAARPDEPARATYLANLGNALLTRAGHLGSEADLDAAIEVSQAAVTGWPDHPEHVGLMANLDRPLQVRASSRDQEAGLDRMIETARNELTAADGLGAATLSELLMTRFERAGNPADVDDAIQVRRNAVAAAVDDSTRAEHLRGLSDLPRLRFIHFGREQDLADAVARGRAAVAATPVEAPELCKRQATLCTALSCRYQAAGDPDDIEEAGELERGGEVGGLVRVLEVGVGGAARREAGDPGAGEALPGDLRDSEGTRAVVVRDELAVAGIRPVGEAMAGEADDLVFGESGEHLVAGDAAAVGREHGRRADQLDELRRFLCDARQEWEVRGVGNRDDEGRSRPPVCRVGTRLCRSARTVGV